jgi:hypothetical protein
MIDSHKYQSYTIPLYAKYTRTVITAAARQGAAPSPLPQLSVPHHQALRCSALCNNQRQKCSGQLLRVANLSSANVVACSGDVEMAGSTPMLQGARFLASTPLRASRSDA